MNTQEFICEARVRFNGKDLALNKIVSHIVLDDIVPTSSPLLYPTNAVDTMHRDERRQRFVDMISAEFAHALTEALFKASHRS